MSEFLQSDICELPQNQIVNRPKQKRRRRSKLAALMFYSGVSFKLPHQKLTSRDGDFQLSSVINASFFTPKLVAIASICWRAIGSCNCHVTKCNAKQGRQKSHLVCGHPHPYHDVPLYMLSNPQQISILSVN